MAERDGDRDHVRPLPTWYAIEPADKFGEEIVGIQFLDERLQERTGPPELRGACGEEPHRTRSKLLPPPLGLKFMLGPSGVFELAIDVEEQVTERTHGHTSSE